MPDQELVGDSTNESASALPGYSEDRVRSLQRALALQVFRTSEAVCQTPLASSDPNDEDVLKQLPDFLERELRRLNRVLTAEAVRDHPQALAARETFDKLREELVACVNEVVGTAKMAIHEQALRRDLVEIRRDGNKPTEVARRLAVTMNFVAPQVRAMMEAWYEALDAELGPGSEPTVMMSRSRDPRLAALQGKKPVVNAEPTVAMASKPKAPVEATATIVAPLFALEDDWGTPAPSLPGPGKVIANRYRIVRIVARTSQSTVYEARHTGTGGAVALKLLMYEADEPEGKRRLSRFRREAAILGRLSTPHTVRIYDFGQDGSTFFLAMEWLDGRTLAALLEDEGPLPLGKVLDFGAEIAQGLAEAHRHGIVHRDVKPSNVMVTRREGRVGLKLLDFGIGKDISADSQLTLHTALIGSPNFMAPEQIRGLPVDGRTDQYGLGVLLFHLLTAQFPFGNRPFSRTLLAHLSEHPASLVDVVRTHVPSLVGAAVPPRLEALSKVVARCLEKERGSRYRDMNEVVAMLREIKDLPDEPIKGRMPVVTHSYHSFGSMPVQASLPPANHHIPSYHSFDSYTAHGINASMRLPPAPWRRRGPSFLESTLRWVGLLTVGLTAGGLGATLLIALLFVAFRFGYLDSLRSSVASLLGT
ncbi:MAG: serine/threonine-protein kinase [Myxococcota bacterium]